jgi:hypothetical protein
MFEAPARKDIPETFDNKAETVAPALRTTRFKFIRAIGVCTAADYYYHHNECENS